MSCVAQAGFKLQVAKDELELLPPGYLALELEAMDPDEAKFRRQWSLILTY